MNHELLIKYRTNHCSIEELYEVLEWFESIAGTPEGKNFLLKEIWEEPRDENVHIEVDFDRLLDEIHHKINLARTKQPGKETNHRISAASVSRFRIWLIRAAAILMFPVLGFGIYMSHKYQSEKDRWFAASTAQQQVRSSVDDISRVTLPDGTNVWLNRSSSLSYPAVFNGKVRLVELVGEGFFEIAHNPDIPFIVQAGKIKVNATGTTFNVMAYPEDENIEVTLIDGLVELSHVPSEGEETFLLHINPGQFVRYEKESDQLSSERFYDDRYYAWKDGKLVFENASMAEMVRRLSRWFNVDIQIESEETLELYYTATFIDETLPQVLELLSKVSPIDYSVSDRKKTADGTFSKPVVTIRKNQK